MADPCPTCGHLEPPPPPPDPTPLYYPTRDPIKMSDTATNLIIGLPTRGTPPVEFQMCNLQLQPLLNARVGYVIQKHMLPAAARNAILEAALKRDVPYVLFLDDDILFPDVLVYRLWVTMQKHPELGVLSGVYTTKIDPPEPLFYADENSGAFWDWPLGALVPIHSGGAGCMLVNMSYVRKLDPPWFNDVFETSGSAADETKVRQLWGHDRYFMDRVHREAGGLIYADTGLILMHFDTKTDKGYTIPPDAPCFQRPMLGEAFVPFTHEDGLITWQRLIPRGLTDSDFKGYLDWLQTRSDPDVSRVALIP